MIPILSSSYPYTGNGLGGLSDAVECSITHEINGEYELMMRYPITGAHFDELDTDKYITAKPDDLTDAQPFRIYRITKPLNGIVTVRAQHVSYDMSGIVVEPFSATSLTEVMTKIPSYVTSQRFTIATNRTVASSFSISEPRPLWKLLGGQSGSLLDVYGGEWDFDKLTATLKTTLGSNRGVTIKYGKNMTSMEQDATIESTYSAVYPFWYDEESNTLVTLTAKTIAIAGAQVTDRVLLLDCSSDFDTAPSEADLIARANAYITANSIGSMKTSWKVSFVDTEDLPFDQIMLGDTLKVEYETLGVQATARAVKTEYDVLNDRYKSVTIGRVKQNLASIIVENQEKTDAEIKEVKSDLETAVDDATDFIRNGTGYMRLIYNANKDLVEIVSLDNPDIAQATNVWRWNNGGFGFSSTGYNGTYGLALTQNGEIVADYITTGTLNANVIRAGILQDALGKNSWNLATGALTITEGSLNINTTSETYDVIKMNSNGWHGEYSPLQVKLINDGTAKCILFQAGAIFGYTNYDGQGNEVQRMTLSPDVGLYFRDANGTTRSALGTGGFSFYNSSGTETARMTPNGTTGGYMQLYGTSGGKMFLASADAATGGLRMYDTSEKLRTLHDKDGLTFYDTNGTAKTKINATYNIYNKNSYNFGYDQRYVSAHNIRFTTIGSFVTMNGWITISGTIPNNTRLFWMLPEPATESWFVCAADNSRNAYMFNFQTQSGYKGCLVSATAGGTAGNVNITLNIAFTYLTSVPTIDSSLLR